MKGVERLKVSLMLGQKEREVGELAMLDGNIYFKYYPEFIQTSFQISPFKLPLKEGIFTEETRIFDGLFGVFNDSLPDGWGRLLLDRKLISEGISPQDLTPLDRLSYVGEQGSGALIYRPVIDSTFKIAHQLALDTLSHEMLHIIEGSTSELLDELFKLGGSSGGARPKIFVGYHPQTKNLIHGQDHLPEGYEHWIIKFPTSYDLQDIAQIEYTYYLMARLAGIEMSECKLFYGKYGKAYFGTKRFDRKGNASVHLHSASGLMHDNFRLSSMDYGHLMDCAFQLEKHVDAYSKVFRLAIFNVFSHNRDDHSKNFSFLMDEAGKWIMAPAYDLTYSSSSHGQHSTTIAGEGKSPKRKHLMSLANHFGIKDSRIIFEEVEHAVIQWKNIAKNAGVSKGSIDLIDQKIQENFS